MTFGLNELEYSKFREISSTLLNEIGEWNWWMTLLNDDITHKHIRAQGFYSLSSKTSYLKIFVKSRGRELRV